jgi:hypothetical protein
VRDGCMDRGAAHLDPVRARPQEHRCGPVGPGRRGGGPAQRLRAGDRDSPAANGGRSAGLVHREPRRPETRVGARLHRNRDRRGGASGDGDRAGGCRRRGRRRVRGGTGCEVPSTRTRYWPGGTVRTGPNTAITIGVPPPTGSSWKNSPAEPDGVTDKATAPAGTACTTTPVRRSPAATVTAVGASRPPRARCARQQHQRHDPRRRLGNREGPVRRQTPGLAAPGGRGGLHLHGHPAGVGRCERRAVGPHHPSADHRCAPDPKGRAAHALHLDVRDRRVPEEGIEVLTGHARQVETVGEPGERRRAVGSRGHRLVPARRRPPQIHRGVCHRGTAGVPHRDRQRRRTPAVTDQRIGGNRRTAGHSDGPRAQQRGNDERHPSTPQHPPIVACRPDDGDGSNDPTRRHRVQPGGG